MHEAVLLCKVRLTFNQIGMAPPEKEVLIVSGDEPKELEKQGGKCHKSNIKGKRNSMPNAENEQEELLLKSEKTLLVCKSLESFDQNLSRVTKDDESVSASQNLSRSSGFLSEIKDKATVHFEKVPEPTHKKSPENSPSKDSFTHVFFPSRYVSCEELSCSDAQFLPDVHLKHINGQIMMIPSATPNERLFYNNQPWIMRYETSQSSESIICRICHSYGDEKLITPCKCAGSSQYVHATCLVTWFKKSVKHQCELCKSDVKIRKKNHHIATWRKPEDRPVPLIWFSVFFIGLFLNFVSIYVNASDYCESTACLIFYVVNGFGIILDAAFLWFWFLKCRQYWKKWCALNQDWFIDDRLDDEELKVQFVQGCPV